MGCVYLALNVVTGKGYVGQTRNLGQRKIEHAKAAQRGSNTVFHRAIRKYGICSFVWSVLTESDDREILGGMEKFYIVMLQTKTPHGYNLTDGGDGGVVGYEHTPETKAKMSASHKGKRHTPEHNANISASKMGKPGHPISLKTRAKLSLALSGIQRSVETKQKMSKAKKGTHPSEEARNKMRVSKIGTKQSQETIAKRISKVTGRKRSEETKAKLREAWVRRKARKNAVS